MEAIEGHEMTVAVVMGGALLAAALKFLTGSVANQSLPKQKQTTKSKSKKNKNKKSKKNKKVTSAEPQVPKQKSKSKTSKTQPVAAMKESEPVVEAQVSKKKKNKPKKNKKKKVTIVEEDSDASSLSSSDEISPESPSKVEAEPLRAADLFDPSKVEDGWESVPVRKNKTQRSNNNLSVGTEKLPLKSNSTGKKKKERKEVVSIGEHAAVVLGEGGATISNIQNVSGARVSVNKENKMCTITGEDEAVLVAQKLVTALMENQSRFEETVTSRLGKSILAKTETKTLIRELTGAKLDYNFGNNKNDPLVLTVSGEKEKVEHARQLIKEYLSGKNPDTTYRRIKVTAFQGRILIGHKGSQINTLQSQSGATINVEFNTSAEGDKHLAEVTVIGSETQIESCLNDIQRFLMEHNVKTAVDLPSDARAVLLKLNELRKSLFNLEVTVADDRSQIVLCGSESGVNEGRSLLKKWIEDELGPPAVKKNESMEAIELGASVGKVVGKGRNKINEIQSKSGVRLMEIKQGTVLYIVGEKEKVVKAAGLVRDIVAKHQQKLAQSEKEQQRLQNAAWEVTNVNSNVNANNATAAQNDYGGFQLAQAQGW